MLAVLGVARPHSKQPAAIFYPFGNPYAGLYGGESENKASEELSRGVERAQ
jgi:hypothetical protein